MTLFSGLKEGESGSSAQPKSSALVDHVEKQEATATFLLNDEADVTLVTSMGDIVIELYWKHAPKTCKNFYELSKSAYYDNTTFHRVVKDFCIQGGDPTGTGRGGESIYGDKFEDEIHPDLRHTGAGVISMANSGPNTNGSQFFICLAPAPFLDGKHSIFGRVKKGMEIVKKISTVQTTATDRPIHDIKIIRAVTATSID